MQPDACYLAKFYVVVHLASSHVVMFDHNLKLMSLEEPAIMQLHITQIHLLYIVSLMMHFILWEIRATFGLPKSSTFTFRDMIY